MDCLVETGLGSPSLEIKALSDKLGCEIPLPYYATDGAAGMDLHACIDSEIKLLPQELCMVPTGLAVSLSGGYAAMIFARSGLAVKHGVALSNGVGVVDSDYRGEIMVGLVNLSAKPYVIRPGDRIAQMVVMPVCRAEIRLVQELGETGRGEGGFGSTGR